MQVERAGLIISLVLCSGTSVDGRLSGAGARCVAGFSESGISMPVRNTDYLPKKMALITSDCGKARFLTIKCP